MLLAAVVGSGIMAEGLAAGNVAIALLANAIATGVARRFAPDLGPISGAHFNPIVALALASRGELDAPAAFAYIVAQVAVAGCGSRT